MIASNQRISIFSNEAPMTDSQSISVFKCPTCGAPLDPTPGMAAMKCPYCGATVIIPETLRTSASSAQNPAQREAPGSLSDVSRLAKEGKLDEAAKIYSRITGLSHENAMFSVKSMAGIYNDAPASSPAPAGNSHTASQSPTATGPLIVNQPQMDSRPGEPFVIDSVPAPTQRRRRRGGSCLGGIINLVIFIVVLSSVFPSLFRSLPFELPAEFPFKIPFLSPGDSIIPAPFADDVFAFSTGSMSDPRAIGVDSDGNIIVGNFSGGEFKVFDPTGNVISSFTAEGDPHLTNIVVARDGVIYIPSDTILMYNMNGEKIGSIGEASMFGYNHVALGPGNAVHAMTNEAILRFDESGRVDLEIPMETLEELSEEPIGIGRIAVDAQGNIYFWGNFDATIFKFSPQGEFLTRFGGEEDSSGNFTPGKFVSPHQIVFDNFGRMYVVDFFNIQVFDENGTYLDKIEPGHYGAAFDAQNNMYAITAADHDVVKYTIKSPVQ
jgi:predicted RNA-binding Zn-ribbon protein involved in translation (DUF1610 family)